MQDSESVRSIIMVCGVVAIIIVNLTVLLVGVPSSEPQPVHHGQSDNDKHHAGQILP